VSAAGTKNIHDIQGGANVWGSAAHVGYEYAGNAYAGLARHGGQKADCIGCHQPKTTRHTMRVDDAAAAGGCLGNGCHSDSNYTHYFNAARALTTTNGYDGNAATTTLSGEIGSFVSALAAAMNGYQRAHGFTAVAQTITTNCVSPLKAGQCAADFVSGANICYDSVRQGFYAEPGNTTGLCATGASAPLKSWVGYDPKMSRAAYNMTFQNAGNDPGYWAHNFDYVAELLYDSITDLGGNAVGLTRP
jgi:hypothetical protein